MRKYLACIWLGDGEETRWNRSDFTGILKDEFLPAWAVGKLKELTGQKDQSLREPTAEELHPVKGPVSPDAPVLK